MNPVHLTLYYNIYNIIITTIHIINYLKKLPVSPHERPPDGGVHMPVAYSLEYILFYNASKIKKKGPRRKFYYFLVWFILRVYVIALRKDISLCDDTRTLLCYYGGRGRSLSNTYLLFLF